MENKIDISKIEKLLEEGNFEEAGKIIKEVLASDLKEEDKGELYFQLIMLYLNSMKKIDADHRLAIDETVMLLNDIDRQEKEAEKAINLALLRGQMEQTQS